jgi:integrase
MRARAGFIGGGMLAAQVIAGHASATMTLDTYGHLMTERVSEAANLYDPCRRRRFSAR